VSQISETDHYDRLADRFNRNWAYSPQFVSWMSTCILDRLKPQPGHRTPDLGCGTGLYAECLADRAGTVVCVDPSATMLEQLPAGRALIPVQGTAEEITGGAISLPHEQFDAILAKEILHHVPRARRPDVLRDLVRMLAPDGRMLLILTPPTIHPPVVRGGPAPVRAVPD
jgi:2-polyprenyl-3-methyl-5-hydroxy-6-metoxy-1,4-benzoquinol methylase